MKKDKPNFVYSEFWKRSKRQQVTLMVFGFLPSLLAKIVPKKADLELFGSFCGAMIGDNSLALYLERKKKGKQVFFVTKNPEATRQPMRDESYPVLASSMLGVWLQLRAQRVYFTHSIIDFNSPFVMGARIICLQHATALKRGGAAVANYRKKKGLRTLLKRYLFPYSYPYFCHEVWSPPGIFVENTREIFALTAPKIVIQQSPRLAAIVVRPSRGKILFAPTSIKFLPLVERLQTWGLLDSNSDAVKFLQRNDLQLWLRPHPIELENVESIFFPHPVKIDSTVDVYESLGSYAHVITDFSSIGYDSREVGIPTSFLTTDLDRFQVGEVGHFPNVLDELHTVGLNSLLQILQLASEIDDSLNSA
jgi:hypothetical protein